MKLTLTEQWEEANLSINAAKSSQSQGRSVPEKPCSLRTCFQRDRDRIVHSKSFRRLKHKTQVFISPEGDHYRTRLTHTLEVSGISRTAARALRLNEDLAEAISLGHDLGHTPFGHIGEYALSRSLKQRTGQGFEHNHHSLRVIRKLENDGRGLNLCKEVEDGILNHTGPDLPDTLEGRIVRIADRIAYVNHDIDDALRTGIISREDLPADEIAILGETCSNRIDSLVHDLVDTSWEKGDIVMTPALQGAMNRLRSFMFKRVYLGFVSRKYTEPVCKLVESLFEFYTRQPELIPAYLRDNEDNLETSVADHIAGMTDRYAISVFKKAYVPSEWPSPGFSCP